MLLAGTCLSSLAAAQSWTGGAGTSDWGTASNWSPATVPNGNSAIAQFGASGSTTVNGTNIALDSIRFNAGAPTYTVTFTGGSLNGGGIVNNSGNPQNVAFAPASSTPGTTTTFTLNNSASLGNANVVVAGNTPTPMPSTRSISRATRRPPTPTSPSRAGARFRSPTTRQRAAQRSSSRIGPAASLPTVRG